MKLTEFSTFENNYQILFEKREQECFKNVFIVADKRKENEK